MRSEIRAFWDKHLDLKHVDSNRIPSERHPFILEGERFVADDRLSIIVSIDYGRWKHISFCRTFFPFMATEDEYRDYLDFFEGTGYFQFEGPFNPDITHFVESNHPEAESIIQRKGEKYE